MSDLPRPETEPPWGVVLRVTANGRAAWYIDGPEISVDGEPGYSEQDARAITALHDWIKLADRQAGNIAHARGYLQVAARAAHAIPNPVTRRAVAQAVDQMASDLKRILTDGEP